MRGVALIVAIPLAVVLLGGVPASQAPAGTPEPAARGRVDPARFATADRCIACHNGLFTPSGADVSIGTNWRPSMMANAARDPYWQAAVRRETLEHPAAAAAIEHECAGCHMPMARFDAKSAGRLGQVFAHLPIGDAGAAESLLAADGVSCTLCHQLADARLGSRESFVANFAIDEPPDPSAGRRVFGPFAVDAGRVRLMRSASAYQPVEAAHIRKAEICASCHTLYTHTLGPKGEALGEFPEQMPYLEWRHSAYRAEASCQDCHMPPVQEPMAISSVAGQPRTGFGPHDFRGGNVLMPKVLNRFGSELGTTALPQELDAAAGRAAAHLQEAAARLELHAVGEAQSLLLDVSVTNLAGHKLPTAYPSRRAWLHVVVRDVSGASVFESGQVGRDGRIAGNDNDDDPLRFEPHHATITQPAQVQIYEAIMVDRAGSVTTGLLHAARYVKDNRLLPRGFDKATAEEDVAVHGDAESDRDFAAGGDRVRYAVSTTGRTGPFTVEVRLNYQPVGYRWARNLDRFDAFETERFVRYYDALASAATTVVAAARLVVR